MLLNSFEHDPTSFKVSINNHRISPKDKQKYLDVLLDHILSWKPHINKVTFNLQELEEFYPKLNITHQNLY